MGSNPQHVAGHHRGPGSGPTGDSRGLARRRAPRAFLRRSTIVALLVGTGLAGLFLHGHMRVNSAFDEAETFGQKELPGQQHSAQTVSLSSLRSQPAHPSPRATVRGHIGGQHGQRGGRTPRRHSGQQASTPKTHPDGRDLGHVEDDVPLPEQWRIVSNGETVTLPSGQTSELVYTHMAMLAELPDKRLVVAFQASGVLEGAEDQRIWYQAAQWGPVLHYSEKRRQLFAFFAESDPSCLRAAPKKGNLPRRYAVGGNIKMSTARLPTEGSAAIHWEEPRTILAQNHGEDKPIPKVIANRMVELSSGQYILPFWRQRSYQVCESPSPNAAGVLQSSDGGATWQAHGEIVLPDPGNHWVIEGSAVELANGTVALYLRSTEGFIYTCQSYDQGTTWGHASPTLVLNPDAKAHALAVPGREGQLLLAYNNHDRPYHGMAKGRTGAAGKRRDTLMLAMSSDSGRHWLPISRLDPPLQLLSGGRSAQGVNMMFHYPTMLVRSSGELLVGYTRTYYPDRRSVDPPLLDGVWLSRLDVIPVPPAR